MFQNGALLANLLEFGGSEALLDTVANHSVDELPGAVLVLSESCNPGHVEDVETSSGKGAAEPIQHGLPLCHSISEAMAIRGTLSTLPPCYHPCASRDPLPLSYCADCSFRPSLANRRMATAGAGEEDEEEEDTEQEES